MVAPAFVTVLPLSPALGYRALSATGCAGTLAGNTYTTGPVTAACAVSATFEKIPLTVTANAGTGGSITPTSASVPYGGAANFTVTPNTGYKIWSVAGCSGNLQGSTFYTGEITSACTISAAFVLIKYNLTASAGTGGTITPAASEISHGIKGEFTVTPSTGYSIKSVSGCSGSLSGNTYTTAAVTAACAVTATFEKIPLTVTANAGTGGSITPTSATVPYGGATNFTVTPNPGYKIWSVVGCPGNLQGTTFYTGEITSACTISAAFELVKYNVTATAETGGSITPTASTISHGTTGSFTVTPSTGYAIKTVSGCSGTLADDQYTTGPVTAACAVIATFEKIPLTVTANAGTGGRITPTSASVPYGGATNFTVTPNPGYKIWSVVGCSGTLQDTTFYTGEITSACTISAAFELVKYNVTATAETGGSITPTASTISHGTTGSFTVTPSTGYAIKTVSGCSGTLADDQYTTGPVTSACAVIATFEKIPLTVTANAGTGGRITPTSASVPYGGATNFAVTPSPGYTIWSVVGCSGTLQGTTFYTGEVTSACTISAAFKAALFNITARAGVGGSITPESSQLEYGSATEFTITPANNYQIKSVTGCAGNLAGNKYTTGNRITENCTVQAIFEGVTYAVTTDADTGGLISPADMNIAHGETATFTITLVDGYNIASIDGCSGQLDGNTYETGPITAACEIKIRFHGMPSGNTIYKYDEQGRLISIGNNPGGN